jgi:hypothetical protein
VRRGSALSIAALVAVAASAVLTSAAAWAAAGVSCRAERAGQRALIQIDVTQLFDPRSRELLHLVELGLVGRLHIETTLFRRRRFWFDPRLVEASHLFSIAWSKDDKRFTLEGRPIASPYDFALPILALRPDGDALDEGDPADGTYVEVLLRLEVVTPTSLGQVARWLVTSPETPADPDPAAAPGPSAPGKTLVPGAVLNLLAADLARKARGTCAVTR